MSTLAVDQRFVSGARVRSGRVRQVRGERLRLTRRGRVVFALLAALVVVGGLWGGQAVADSPSRGTEVQTYAVQPGDTLWAIAAGIAGPGEDIRDVVADLQQMNGLSSASITAGEVIVLPVTD